MNGKCTYVYITNISIFLPKEMTWWRIKNTVRLTVGMLVEHSKLRQVGVDAAHVASVPGCGGARRGGASAAAAAAARLFVFVFVFEVVAGGADAAADAAVDAAHAAHVR